MQFGTSSGIAPDGDDIVSISNSSVTSMGIGINIFKDDSSNTVVTGVVQAGGGGRSASATAELGAPTISD